MYYRDLCWLCMTILLLFKGNIQETSEQPQVLSTKQGKCEGMGGGRANELMVDSEEKGDEV